jgi:hypothetical protein
MPVTTTVDRKRKMGGAYHSAPVASWRIVPIWQIVLMLCPPFKLPEVADYLNLCVWANTENYTLEFRSRKRGNGIRPFKLRVIRNEFVKLG